MIYTNDLHNGNETCFICHFMMTQKNIEASYK